MGRPYIIVSRGIMNNAKITLENMNVHFGSNHAVKSVSLEFIENTVTAIIGPSGCGKSTLLRSINRMHDLVPSAKVTGRILFDGMDLYGRSVDPVAIRRKIGMVFQKPNPFPAMNIYDNVVAGYKLNNRMKRSDSDEIVETSLKRVALWDEVKDRLKTSAMDLSGGQQQRLCIARTIAVQPEVILMDEPCSALDPIATLKIEELVVRKNPDVAGSLVVDAIVKNHATFPQPFPVLRLRFSNAADEIVASRNLRPAEYLRGEARMLRRMPPDTPVRISVDIVDPGKDAISYGLDPIL